MSTRGVVGILCLGFGLSGCSVSTDSIFDDNYKPGVVPGGKGDVGGRAESGYRAVGSLRAGGLPFCSATLVMPNVVITAAHCLRPILDGSIFGYFPPPSTDDGGSGGQADGGGSGDVDLASAGSVDAGGGRFDGGVSDEPIDLAISSYDGGSGSGNDLGEPAIIPHPVGISAMRRVATFALGGAYDPEQETELDIAAAAFDPRYTGVAETSDWDHLADPEHDIAVIFLKAPIEGIKPARIAKIDPSSLPNVCSFRSIGYGITDADGDAQERRSAVKCYEGTSNDPEGTDIRVSAPTGATCYGDSGGALAFASADEPIRVVGVTSRLGDASQQNDPCAFGGSSFYTGAYAHKDFIASVIEKYSP